MYWNLNDSIFDSTNMLSDVLWLGPLLFLSALYPYSSTYEFAYFSMKNLDTARDSGWSLS